jgi:tRNA nucleotidyltransferase (CCA-adding enzyme)
MILPGYVLELMEALEDAGFQAWAVGGCVRDALLGKAPQDYDLCTSASPAQTQAVFAHRQLVLAGEKHGTVAVVTASGVIEITTFRTEGGYDDRRHPGWVRFVGSVEEDLARRDFTVNAMAYSPKRGFSDPFGGQKDLKQSILRAVGDPEKRFTEDALRILRGTRFAVTYRLRPDEATLRAMNQLAPSIRELARERVYSELCKLIPRATEADFHRFGHILRCAVAEFGDFSAAARLPENLELRLAALLLEAEAPAQVLSSLRSSAAVRESVVFLVENAKMDTSDLPKVLCRHTRPQIEALLQLQQALHPADPQPAAQAAALAQIPPVTLQTLAVSGADLIAQGHKPGAALGQTLQALLYTVLSRQVPNEKSALLALCAKLH